MQGLVFKRYFFLFFWSTILYFYSLINKFKLRYVIGIDCGATKSEAIIMLAVPGALPELSGWGVTRLPAVNFNLLGFDSTKKRLIEIIKKASSKVKIENVDCICIGISGAGFEKDRKKLQGEISKALRFKNIRIYPDTEIAFASIFDAGQKNCGILIAGTGTILYYRDSKKKMNKVGGWGRHFGDEGSGYWIAREALSKVTQCYDGRIANTSLLKILEREYNFSPASIVKEIYHNNFEISRITKHVFEEAGKGDKISKSIIKNAAKNLLHHFAPIGKKNRYKIALCGSLFSEEKLLEKYLRQLTKVTYPNIEFVKPLQTPVWGAVKMALIASEARQSQF